MAKAGVRTGAGFGAAVWGQHAFSRRVTVGLTACKARRAARPMNNCDSHKDY
jgi:hypothetical protein